MAKKLKDFYGLNETETHKNIYKYLLSLLDVNFFLDRIYKIRKDYKIPKEGYRLTRENKDGLPLKEWEFFNNKDKNKSIDKEIKNFCIDIKLEPKNWLFTIRAYIFYSVIIMKSEQHLTQVISHEYREKIIEKENDYPVIIRVGPYASKREIIDYINKLYIQQIKPIQEKYKQTDITIGKVKKRKNSIRNDFIYKNKNIQRKEIASLVAKEFNEYLDVGLIGKIIQLEKIRRKDL